MQIDWSIPVCFTAPYSCCYGNETCIIIDNGIRWAVCLDCALNYEGEVFDFHSDISLIVK